MKAEVINIKENEREIDYEDIICLLNPLQSCDLKQILMMTHVDRRLNVALAFANIDYKTLCVKAGLLYTHNNHVYKWLNGNNRLPLGIAFRLSKVLGVPVEILFASPMYKKGDKQSDRK